MVHAKKPLRMEEITPPVKEEKEEKSSVVVVPSLDSFLNSPSMRTIVRILLNGRDSRHTMRPFLRHEELMQSMLRAYEQQDMEGFLKSLRHYLDLAALNLPHGGYSSHVDPLVGMVKSYIENPYCGFAPIATRILGVRNAPV